MGWFVSSQKFDINKIRKDKTLITDAHQDIVPPSPFYTRQMLDTLRLAVIGAMATNQAATVQLEQKTDSGLFPAFTIDLGDNWSRLNTSDGTC